MLNSQSNWKPMYYFKTIPTISDIFVVIVNLQYIGYWSKVNL